MIRVGFCSHQVGCWYTENELSNRRDDKGFLYLLITISTSKLHQEKIISDACSVDCTFLLQSLSAEDKSLHFKVMSIRELRANLLWAWSLHRAQQPCAGWGKQHSSSRAPCCCLVSRRRSTQRLKLSRALLSFSAVAHVWGSIGDRCGSCLLSLLLCWAQ